MEGIRLRLSRFAGEGSRLIDLTLVPGLGAGAEAYIVFPRMVPSLMSAKATDRGTVLLMRLTSWDGTAVLLLHEPRAVPYQGGEGCVVDLAVGYGDAAEIGSLRILSEVRGGAQALGLPVISRLVFNPEAYPEDIADNLNVPLTIAEEMGADGIILPHLEEEELSRLREPQVPYFLTREEGSYVRGAR